MHASGTDEIEADDETDTVNIACDENGHGHEPTHIINRTRSEMPDQYTLAHESLCRLAAEVRSQLTCHLDTAMGLRGHWLRARSSSNVELFFEGGMCDAFAWIGPSVASVSSLPHISSIQGIISWSVSLPSKYAMFASETCDHHVMHTTALVHGIASRLGVVCRIHMRLGLSLCCTNASLAERNVNHLTPTQLFLLARTLDDAALAERVDHEPDACEHTVDDDG